MSYAGSMTTSVDSLSITANDSGPNLSWTIEKLAQTYNSSNSLKLTYQVTLDDSVEPAEVLTNAAELSWTSHPDEDNDDRRTGPVDEDDALNDYLVETNTDLTINDDLDISKEITSTGTEYAIGDTVGYKVTIDLIKGTINGLEVDNLIPEGLKADSFTLKDGDGNVLTKAEYLTDQDLSDNNLIFDVITNSAVDGIAGDKITIEYDAVVENITDNQNGDVKEITTDLYYDDDSGAQQNLTANNTPISIIEPELALSKSFAAGSYEAGDTVEYTITVNHSGDSTAEAYDLTVEDIIPTGMTYVAGSMTTSVDSLSITANDSGPNLSWTIEELAQAYDSTNKLVLTYQVTIDDSVEPAEVLTNAAELSWTSHPDDTKPDQRTGAAGDSLNDYIQTAETDLTLNDDLSIAKLIIGGETEYAVGDTVSYQVDI